LVKEYILGEAMANVTQRKTFLSYSRVNKDFALKLAEELKSEGFNIWFDQLDIPPGARWDTEIEKALDEADIFMVIITPASAKSDNVLDEIGYAIDTGKRILPVLLEAATLPLRLRRFQYVDFTSKSFNEGIKSARELLENLIDQPTLSGIEVPVEFRAQVEAERGATPQKKYSVRGLVIGIIVAVVFGVAGIGYALLSKGENNSPSIDGPAADPATETSVNGPAAISATETSVVITPTSIQPSPTIALSNTPESTVDSVPINVDTAIRAAFVQSAMSGDMTGRNLYIDKEKHKPASKPNVLVFAMPNYKSPEPPSDYPGVYYDYPVCVWYTGTQWSIVKISGMESIPWKTAFNIQILDKGSNVDIHTATTENTPYTPGYWTVIDSKKFPLASDSSVLVFATFNLSASTGRGKYFDKPIGVLYKDGQWVIYNRDLTDMPEGTAFNVQIVTPDTPGTNAFVYKVESPVDNWAIIKNFAMPRGTLQSNGAKYDQNIGVWFNGSTWVIFNQKKNIPMPEGTEFNIMIVEPK